LVSYWDKYTEMHGQQNVKKIYTGWFSNSVIPVLDGGTELENTLLKYMEQLMYKNDRKVTFLKSNLR